MTPEYRDDENESTRNISSLTDQDTDLESRDHTLHIRNASDTTDNGLPIPIWMRESAQSFKYKWVPLPLRKAGRATAEWIKGPKPSRELRIKPLYPQIQEAPLRLMDRYLPKQRHRICLLIASYAVWLLIWSLMLKHNSASAYIEGYGKPSNIWCGASFWDNGNGCGLNGNRCRPFSSAHLAFRCPSNCRAVQLLEPYLVGNQSVVYQGLVIGGPNSNDPDSMPVYRGDSFICQAAIHAGVIANGNGGCGVATLTGTHHNFQPSNANGIQSIGFPASFPRTYTFQTLSSAQSSCPTDSRWPLFAITATFLILLWLVTTSPATLFFSTFFILSLHVGFVSDPPNTSNFRELLSILASRLLPASFVAWILYRYCARPTLTNLTAQIEKTVLYLGFCLIGALNNYTFAPLIPIQRLTPHDIKAQPGAPLALAVIVTSILAIVITQIHYIRISGQMPRYLKLYITFLAGLLILLLLPGMRLRIHHYILALLFMPGTAMQTRPALIYQGLLLGLGENISFSWGGLPRDKGVDGVSILVDDVERWRGYVDAELNEKEEGITLQRGRGSEGEPEFYRFAWMNGNSAGRYGGVGIWDQNGIWIPPRSWELGAKR
ncbi:hypothetical protein EPUS_04469 [Endocarpon pusillum Z07020]|uniref:LCCL domain-containing protein n=1 Tax=Endocarpon pusillum (strain Z07020 / HMAS-L-300199) TaxID=1263415 RepID=U1I3N8_ENDPU|nr:uncharacterized protein EPUS_04469 [Endocarpon pusillum Z07020]ERF76649.1 hypothetical protein EPUS_04469 [Endocarpon pusillum Z07020]